jgi:hypothetical protein
MNIPLEMNNVQSVNMTIDKFLDMFFENLTDQNGIDTIKKSTMNTLERYDKTEVYFNVLGNDNESDRDVENVEISSEGYDDAEVVNVDVLLAEKG